MMRSTIKVLGALACGAAVAVSAGGGRPESAMTRSAKGFLASLDSAQRMKAVFPFESEERLNWHFIPRARKGLPLKEMTPEQQKAALALLATGFSAEANKKATTIRALENVLKAQEMGRGAARDPELYFFTVFGEPSDTATWGWRYEGHHHAQNWTIVKGKTTATSPQFFGSNPAEVRTEAPGGPPKGTRALAPEEDLARALLASLTPEQMKVAVTDAKAPNDIMTGAERKVGIQAETGLSYKEMGKEQQDKLTALIREYVNAMPKALADQRMAKLRQAGLDGIRFAWMGATERGAAHYYRVQGSTFLIEYDNTQNNANHIHSVWRDFNGDFGMDLLAMHYQASPHRVAVAR